MMADMTREDFWYLLERVEDPIIATEFKKEGIYNIYNILLGFSHLQPTFLTNYVFCPRISLSEKLITVATIRYKDDDRTWRSRLKKKVDKYSRWLEEW